MNTTVKNKEVENLIRALQSKVNSALLTCENHTSDNSFLESDIMIMVEGLRKCGYIPKGICTSIPYSPYDIDSQIGFVFTYNDEIQWIHMPKVTFFGLLDDYYGREKAEQIYDELGVH